MNECMYGMHQPLFEEDGDSNPVITESTLFLFSNTFNSVLIVENLCKKLRIDQQLFNSKSYIYYDKFSPQRDRPIKVLHVVFLIYFLFVILNNYTSLRAWTSHNSSV